MTKLQKPKLKVNIKATDKRMHIYKMQFKLTTHKVLN